MVYVAVCLAVCESANNRTISDHTIFQCFYTFISLCISLCISLWDI